MNQYIYDKVRAIAVEIITDALDNGDAEYEARKLRDGIRAGWHQALDDCGMPEEMQARLKFPL